MKQFAKVPGEQTHVSQTNKPNFSSPPPPQKNNKKTIPVALGNNKVYATGNNKVYCTRNNLPTHVSQTNRQTKLELLTLG